MALYTSILHYLLLQIMNSFNIVENIFTTFDNETEIFDTRNEEKVTLTETSKINNTPKIRKLWAYAEIALISMVAS